MQGDIIVKEATCTENGKRTFTCTICGTSKTEVAEDLPAIGHNWSDSVIMTSSLLEVRLNDTFSF